MIAPLKEKPRLTRSPALRRAHRLLAATFFRDPSEGTEAAGPIPAWKAWAFAAWLVATTLLYLAHMLRII